MGDILEDAEQQMLFGNVNNDQSSLVFEAKGSSGRNPVKLAQILSTFDFVMNLMGWQDKPLANLTIFLTQYQASIDAKYHNDYKEIKIAEEIERRRSERKGTNLSILQG